MHPSKKSVVGIFSATIAAVLGLVVAGCASGESSGGPAGPTVKVQFDSPSAVAVIANGRDVGITPVSVDIPVDDTTGFLKFDLAITFDASKAMGSNGAAAKALGGTTAKNAGAVSWMTGKHLPAKVTVVNGNVTESREYAPANPPGTKASVERE